MWIRKDPPPGFLVFQGEDKFWRVGVPDKNGKVTVFKRADGTERAYKQRMYAVQFAERRYQEQQKAGGQKA